MPIWVVRGGGTQTVSLATRQNEQDEHQKGSRGGGRSGPARSICHQALGQGHFRGQTQLRCPADVPVGPGLRGGHPVGSVRG